MSHFARAILIENIEDADREFSAFGVHKQGIGIMAPKAVFRAIKLKGISSTAANILKQDMLSRGGEAATSKGTIDHSSSSTDVILLGTITQYKSVINRLKNQQFGLRDIAQEIESVLDNCAKSPAPILGMEFGTRTFLMGILNVTPDSFSDGGSYLDEDSALAHSKKMAEDGADIIDVGGESTKPGSKDISEDEELGRIIPVISKLKGISKIISVDTRKSSVAQKAILAGANMINDISGAHFDPLMPDIAAKYNVPIIVMHSKGTPADMQNNPVYEDLISDILKYFDESISVLERAGVKKENIILDPGIGFGKTLEHNLEIMRRLNEFKCFGHAICIGVSRKSFVGKILNEEMPKNRDEGTAACAALAISKKVDIIRIHNVNFMKKISLVSDRIIRRNDDEKEKH